MARIRTIKPEFWTSAQVMECSTNARLMFIGLWNFADDAGRHPDNPKQIKAEIFPADDVLLENVRGMIDELSANGLVKLYTVGSSSYLQILGWRHQRIEKPQNPRYPGPGEDRPDVIPGTIDEPSRLILSDTIRKDTIRKDTIRRTASPTSDAPPPEKHESSPAKNGHAEPTWIADLKTIYPERAGDQDWPRALRNGAKRIKEGHTPEQFLDGARRYAAYVRATGKERTEFVKQAASFIGSGTSKPFLDAWTPPATKADNRTRSNLEAAAEAKRRLFGAEGAT